MTPSTKTTNWLGHKLKIKSILLYGDVRHYHFGLQCICSPIQKTKQHRAISEMMEAQSMLIADDQYDGDDDDQYRWI